MTMEAVLEVREPRYVRVKSQIADRIAQLRPGGLIPPERDLAVVLGTSRTTIRKAVTELVAEGRLVRRQGSGTYVAEPKMAWPLTVSGFAGQPEAEGLRAHTVLLSAEHLPAEGELAEHLGLSPGEPALALRLLRSVKDVPMALECVYLSARRYPGLEAELAESDSMYQILRERIGDRVAHAMETIETVPASPHEAALLGTEIGTPMLFVTRHGHTADGEPVEWVRTWYRGDRYSFVARISRPPAAPGITYS
ncbi:GntR family transcriptional regulator [Actinospica durhamensis]|uniref:GntR family transcriptional regulator n=1 Tax=Actinospica durhamensis TaxID=1508375 RepID=A0A941EXC9_9ACTN|nr:GntR family transcriptional regulator [Actinospica durhamensis]MBR7835684.1 GntR family transcriptional regulator [Actinospica durhamensis]